MWSRIEVKVLVLVSLVVGACCDCHKVVWSPSFDFPGWSICDNTTDVINGFCRNHVHLSDDRIGRLEHALCCSLPEIWKGVDYFHANWSESMDSDNTWSVCPVGYFLSGLYRTKPPSTLGNIEEGQCRRSLNHPTGYGDCYDKDISQCFSVWGCCRCNSGSYVVGLYRGNCSDLRCLEKLRCCKMAAKPIDLTTDGTDCLEQK